MVNRLRFTVAGGIGVVALSVVMLTFLLGGVAYPVQLGNIGSFRVAVDSVSAGDFSLTPSEGGGGGEGLPAGLANLGDASSGDHGMQGLVLEKEIDLGEVIPPAEGETWTLRISTEGNVTGSGVQMDAVQLCAADTDMQDVSLGDGFALDAGSVSLSNLRMEATSLQASSLSMPDMRVEVLPEPYDGELFGSGSCLQ
jgi:hypothetical protein